MEKKTRSIKRRHLIYYLEVFDEKTDKLLGHIVDLSTKGIKIVSREPIKEEQRLKLKMVIPKDIIGRQDIHFTVKSLWSRNDVNPDLYDTGCEIISELEPNAKKMIKDLIEDLGFDN